MAESLAEEHRRLVEAFRQLQAEHEAVEQRPGDLAAHHEHNARLREHIEALRRHIERLRRQ